MSDQSRTITLVCITSHEAVQAYDLDAGILPSPRTVQQSELRHLVDILLKQLPEAERLKVRRSLHAEGMI